VTVGQYAGIPLEDPADTMRHGAIFLLRRPPNLDAAISLDGWTTQVQRGTKAVVTFGPGRATDASGVFSEALEAANNGLDFMSVRGLADVAMESEGDDSIVWWLEGNSAVVQATVYFPFAFSGSAAGVTRDAQGNVVPSPPLNPLQHDAFRFIRMSRTSAYLYDSYRNMFLALERLLSDVTAQQNEGEAAWFRRALGVVDTSGLVPAAELAPPSETDPITWAYNNIYADARSALMHAKRSYLLPLDDSVRQRLTDSLDLISNYVHKLVEAHLGIAHLWFRLSDYARRQLVEHGLMNSRLFVSDDRSAVGGDTSTEVPAASSNVVYSNPSQFRMVDEWHGDVTASWSPTELSELDAVCLFGVVQADGGPGGFVSSLRGPLTLGSSVSRFELRSGLWMLNASDTPRHFVG
jgi:hypothetical protein